MADLNEKNKKDKAKEEANLLLKKLDELIKESKQQLNNNNNLKNVSFMILFSVIFVTMLVGLMYLSQNLSLNKDSYMQMIIMVIGLMVGLFSGLNAFLLKSKSSIAKYDKELLNTSNLEISDFYSNKKSTENELNHDEEVVSSIKSIMQEKFENILTQQRELIDPEEVMKIVNRHVDELKKSLNKENEIYDRAQVTLNRIYEEIGNLEVRARLNLLIGITVAFLGFLILGYFIIISNDIVTLLDLAVKFLPRLSIVILVEIFSFFFLKLYKITLQDIKYFQNEATNIEYNFIALEKAFELSDNDLIHKVMERFINVEKNPLLEEGQITKELVSEKLTGDSIKLSSEYLVEIIKAIKN